MHHIIDMKQDTNKILKQFEREERLKNIVPIIWISLIPVSPIRRDIYL